MDFTSFSHGQIASKQWLCQHLEPFLNDDDKIAILGSWYNLTGFLLAARSQHRYPIIDGYDHDSNCKTIADFICNAFLTDFNGPIRNITLSADLVNFAQYDVVINTSCEHMDRSWYNLVIPRTLVCLQTSDMNKEANKWDVTYPCCSLEQFKDTYPMNKVFFAETKEIAYSNFSYRRFMLIGLK